MSSQADQFIKRTNGMPLLPSQGHREHYWGGGVGIQRRTRCCQARTIKKFTKTNRKPFLFNPGPSSTREIQRTLGQSPHWAQGPSWACGSALACSLRVHMSGPEAFRALQGLWARQAHGIFQRKAHVFQARANESFRNPKENM